MVCTKTVSIVNELGLHARSAASMAQIAAKAKNNVWLIKGDQKVDASSIIDILGLACCQGTTISLEVEHQEDLPILDELVDLVNAGFGE